MKRLSKVLLLLLAVCSVSSATCSCDNPKKLVKKNALAYLDAMANYRVDDAEPYCTYETQITTLATARNLIEAVEPGYIESDTPAKVVITKITLTSDTTATVKFHKTTPIKSQDGELEMVLRDGQWKANVVLERQLKMIRAIENGTLDTSAAKQPQAPVQYDKKGNEIKVFDAKSFRENTKKDKKKSE